MSDAALHVRARDLDEETRYRAVSALDADDAADRAVLVERLGDPSWRVRSAVVDRIGAMAEPRAALPPLLEALGPDADAGTQECAAAALARLGPLAVGAAVERLGHPHPAVRQAAAGVLGAIADRRAVVPLAARLADPEANVRAAAAGALGRIGGPEAGAALVAALDSDDATLRLSAVEAIAALHVPLPGARIAALLEDRAVRVTAFRLLGAAGDDAAVVAALAAGLAERSRVAREAALAALGEQRARRAAADVAPLAHAARIAARNEPAAPDLWATSLGAEEPLVVLGALAALGWAGAAAHAVAIADRAEDDRYRGAVEEALEALPPTPELREALAAAVPRLPLLARVAALAALARVGSASAFEGLAVRATDADPQVQAEAIAAMGRLGAAAAAMPLAGLLGDDAPTVSGLAATALTRIALGSAAGRAAVLAECRARATASPSSAVYRVLGAVGEASDVELVRAGLRAGEVVHRIASASAIASLGVRGLLPPELPELRDALRDGAWSVRAAAARAVADLARAAREPAGAGPGRACAPVVEALLDALADPEDAVRASAAEALGWCGATAHAGRIAALLDDPRVPPLVAVAALRALARLGPPAPDRRAAAARILALCARHRDAEVVKQAIAAAGRVPGPETRELLREAAVNARWDVRRAAASAFAARGEAALAPEVARLARDEGDPLVARAFAEAAEALARARVAGPHGSE